MIKKCLICNNSFYIRPADIKRGRGKYCSTICYYVSLKGNSFFKGKKHSEETKKKISEMHKGKRHNPKGEFKKGQNVGKNNYRWKGGVYIDKDGYKRIKVSSKYILEHRLVMEKHLHKPLEPSKVVHHLDGNITNNHISNLFLCTRSEHRKLHCLSPTQIIH